MWQLIWQSPGRSILIKILISILIPLIFALVLPILLILVFVIAVYFLICRWLSIFAPDDEDFNTGDMKVPTFYSSHSVDSEGALALAAAFTIMMSVVGIVFGGIHCNNNSDCIGWFFNFPSSDEAMLWRVSSAILTGIAALYGNRSRTAYFSRPDF
jgi:hypothetical protein